MNDETFFSMCKYERELAATGIVRVGGVDEAGRGPLAGPVVAACVVFPVNGPFPRANDSKKLTEKARESLYEEITGTALSYGIGLVENTVIDEINILNATHLAMKQAVLQCCPLPETVLVDHLRIHDLPVNQVPITHGDALSVSIAAASILAKVTRDRLMRDYAKVYPEYGFEKHKGYGTKAHYAAIDTYGITPIHRKSFLKNLGLR